MVKDYIPNRHNIWDFIIGGIIGTILLLPFTIPVNSLFEPVPYRNVEVTRFEQDGKTLFFEANFEKVECEIQRLDVFAETFDRWDRLDWAFIDPTKSVRTGDPGIKSVGLKIHLPKTPLDRLEIKVRHECDGYEKPFDSNLFEGRYVEAEVLNQ